MKESFEFDLRYSEISDSKALMKWLSKEEDAKWFPFSEKEQVEDGVRNWIGFSRFRASLTAVYKNKPCGIGTIFLMPYKKVSQNCMFYLIVDPKYRNQGIGSSLVQNLKNLAKNYFSLEGMYAEIYEGCRVLSILEKCDFEISARQEKFVKEKDGSYRARILLEHFFT